MMRLHKDRESEPSAPEVPKISIEDKEASHQIPTNPQRPGVDIIFPPEHILCRLKDLWSEDKLDNEQLCLHLLPLESEEFLPFENITYETAVLKMSLTRGAKKRWAKIFSDSAHPNQQSADLDEKVFVYVTSDRMSAWILLFPPVGRGRRLNRQEIEQALAKRGVVYGVREPFLKELLELEDRYFQMFLIACGTAPVHGQDGYVVDHYPRAIQEQIQVDELACANYITLNLVQDVQKGEVICDIIPPTPGIEGKTITGNPVPAKDGAKVVIPKGRNTVVSQDGAQLLSTCAGHVEFSGRNFQVKPVLEIFQTVDHSVGNLNFLGDIHIHGDVCRGLTVRATGNIQVDGIIEASAIEAGENLVVSSGVQGQDGAVLRAHKSIYAKYLEHCDVYARESVQADCIINCNIYSDGIVRTCTGRGVIIGGTIHAAREVSAFTIGSKAERLTNILLGGSPCEDSERTQILEELAKIENEISKLEQQDSPDQQDTLSQLRLNMYIVKMKLNKFDTASGQKQDQDSRDHQRRLICDTMYPGTMITIDHKALRIEKIERNCNIGLLNGRIRRI